MVSIRQQSFYGDDTMQMERREEGLTGWQVKNWFQGDENSRLHQKSINANTTASTVSRMRWGVSHPLLIVDADDVGDVVNVGDVESVVEVTMATGVENWRLLHAGWVPLIIAGIEVAFT